MTWQVEFRGPYAGKSFVLDLESNDERFLGSKDGLVPQGVGVRGPYARVFTDSSKIYIEPANETPLTLNGQSLSSASPLAEGDWIAVGPVLFQTRIVRTPSESPGGETIRCGSAVLTGPRRVIRIGRHSACDLVIDSPLVSRLHAEILDQDGTMVLHDLGSTNGTHVNARRVVAPVALRGGDRVEIATFAYTFTGTALEPVDSAGRVCVEAHGLGKEVRDRATGEGKQLLHAIDLVVNPGEFVAIFGTSGSGKSTLLDALNGRRPASSGRVLYNGIDLYSAFNLFRAAIGYVPQQDIVHRRISIENALRYTARLRLPPDTLD